MKAKRVHECRGCGYQESVTAGTIFHKTRTPLRDWFWAIYRTSQGKKGISALQLSKEIGVGYSTAWLMQHKIRQAIAGREQGRRLRGLVEMDEGVRGRGGEGLRQHRPTGPKQVFGGGCGGTSEARKPGRETGLAALGLVGDCRRQDGQSCESS